MELVVTSKDDKWFIAKGCNDEKPSKKQFVFSPDYQVRQLVVFKRLYTHLILRNGLASEMKKKLLVI